MIGLEISGHFPVQEQQSRRQFTSVRETVKQWPHHSRPHPTVARSCARSGRSALRGSLSGESDGAGMKAPGASGMPAFRLSDQNRPHALLRQSSPLRTPAPLRRGSGQAGKWNTCAPDEAPGLVPVTVYRFGSVIALFSLSAPGCIVVPQTQAGSEYLLAANGLFRRSSEGGKSNTEYQ